MGDAEATQAEADGKSVSLWKQEKGGFRACSFIYALIALESMGFIANMVSLVLYFFWVMYFDIPTASTTVTNFMGTTFLLSLVGAIISDTYLNRLHTILIFGALEVLSLVMVTIQAHSKHLHPEYCGGKPSCVKGNIAFMLYASLSLLALGSGGVRGALPAMGADQFDEKVPREAKALASYFNWLTLSTVFGATIGVTAIVWVSMNKDWYIGFLISTVATFLGFVILAFGKPYYRFRRHGDSPFLRVIQVIVVAVKNRGLPLPESAAELYEIDDKQEASTDYGGLDKIAHTDQFRFLDKAAIFHGGNKESAATAAAGRVCTVTQVEEVKILTRMLPILASTIIMNTCMAQLQTFSVQQGSYMEPHLGKLKVPAPSIPAIPLLFMVILIPLYEFFFVPFARKITGHPSGITQLQRVGVGLVLSAVSMAVAGAVEVKRRNQAINHPTEPHISLFWLSFQYGIFGIADMFTLVGLLEFFYKEAPSNMKSLSTSFTWLSLSFGYFFSTVIVNIINAVTRRVTASKEGWLHGLYLDQNQLDLFYWFLAILSTLNFFNYLYWASWYKYKSDREDDDDDIIIKPKAVEISAGDEAAKEKEQNVKIGDGHGDGDEGKKTSESRSSEANDADETANANGNDSQASDKDQPN